MGPASYTGWPHFLAQLNQGLLRAVPDRSWLTIHSRPGAHLT